MQGKSRGRGWDEVNEKSPGSGRAANIIVLVSAEPETGILVYMIY